MYSVMLLGGAFFEVIVLFHQAPGFSMASHEISIGASQAVFDLASELKFSNQRHRHRPHAREHHANRYDPETACSCMRRACSRCVPSSIKDKQEQHRQQENMQQQCKEVTASDMTVACRQDQKGLSMHSRKPLPPMSGIRPQKETGLLQPGLFSLLTGHQAITTSSTHHQHH